jgi:hypothetical protein
MTVRILLSVVFFTMTLGNLTASPQDSPVEHMTFLSDREELLRKKYMSYMSEVAHGERARKMEKRRAELISSVEGVIRDARKLRGYKGDVALRDTFIEYWSILLNVFREDYHKIVDMEEVAEQSYDLMEAYILAQEKAEEKLEHAYEKVPEAYSAFAGRHNVTLTEGQQSKLARKLEKVAAVSKYMNQIYLIYFKSSVQESNVTKALSENNINGVEQSKNALQKYSQEGLVRLDTLKPYNGDGSLITACRKILEFHRAEADVKIPVMSNYLIKSEEFAKLKKSFETKPAQTRTKADVDSFNQAINNINKEVALFNKTSEELNVARNKVLTNWDQTKKRFMNAHIPFQ